VKLNGRTTLAYPVPAASHFLDVNILGTDFLTSHNAKFYGHDDRKEVILVFSDYQWK